MAAFELRNRVVNSHIFIDLLNLCKMNYGDSYSGVPPNEIPFDSAVETSGKSLGIHKKMSFGNGLIGEKHQSISNATD